MPRPLDSKMVISCAFGCQNRQGKPNTKVFLGFQATQSKG